MSPREPARKPLRSQEAIIRDRVVELLRGVQQPHHDHGTELIAYVIAFQLSNNINLSPVETQDLLRTAEQAVSHIHEFRLDNNLITEEVISRAITIVRQIPTGDIFKGNENEAFTAIESLAQSLALNVMQEVAKRVAVRRTVTIDNIATNLKDCKANPTLFQIVRIHTLASAIATQLHIDMDMLLTFAIKDIFSHQSPSAATTA